MPTRKPCSRKAFKSLKINRMFLDPRKKGGVGGCEGEALSYKKVHKLYEISSVITL